MKGKTNFQAGVEGFRSGTRSLAFGLPKAQ